MNLNSLGPNSFNWNSYSSFY